MALPITKHKTCKKCGNLIPPSAVVNGKTRSLWPRSYCLTCSPFGGHNNQKLETLRTDGKKTCRDCNHDFPLSEFIRYRHKNGQRVVRYENCCRSCIANAFTALKRNIKQELVALLGGCCEECGYNKCIDALCFHHIDPSQKEFELSKHPTRTGLSDKQIEEVKKCALLCLNCHAEVHANLRGR